MPAFAGGERGILDLLAVDHAGRLAVVELKASADLHLPLQALDYWIRVKWHLDRGEFGRAGYFPGIELRPEPPRLLLVAPSLEFHPTTGDHPRASSPRHRCGTSRDRGRMAEGAAGDVPASPAPISRSSKSDHRILWSVTHSQPSLLSLAGRTPWSAGPWPALRPILEEIGSFRKEQRGIRGPGGPPYHLARHDRRRKAVSLARRAATFRYEHPRNPGFAGCGPCRRATQALIVDVESSSASSYAFYREYRDRNRVFTSLAASAADRRHTGGRFCGSGSREVAYVSGNYFATLGMGAATGRMITAADDLGPAVRPSPCSLILTGRGASRAWSSAACRSLYRVKLFDGLPADAFAPITMYPLTNPSAVTVGANMYWLTPIARLKPGVSLDQAQAPMRAMAPSCRSGEQHLVEKQRTPPQIKRKPSS